MRLRGRLTTIPDDLPVPDGTEGEVRTVSGDTLLATISTTDGWYEYTQDGNPGPIYIHWLISSVIKDEYSTITGLSGPIDIPGQVHVNRAWSNGYIPSVGGELLVTATGSSMSVAVAAGAAVVQGVLYDQVASKNLVVSAAHATLPRLDYVIVRVVPAGAGTSIEGKSEVLIKAGTPTSGATPLNGLGAPTLTQTTAMWEEAIGLIHVEPAVSVIGSDKVYRHLEALGTVFFSAAKAGARTVGRGSIGTTELADDAVTNAKIASGAVNIDSIAAESIDFPKIFPGAVQGDRIQVGGVNRNHINTSAGVDILMPVTEFVATGNISAGTRTLVTLGVGPLESGVQYAVFAYMGVTLRNSGSSGTVSVRCAIDGGPLRTHEFQNVGGVPRWAPVTQTAVVTGSGASINVVGSIEYISPDTTDVRAGWLQVVALPLSVLGGI